MLCNRFSLLLVSLSLLAAACGDDGAEMSQDAGTSQDHPEPGDESSTGDADPQVSSTGGMSESSSSTQDLPACEGDPAECCDENPSLCTEDHLMCRAAAAHITSCGEIWDDFVWIDICDNRYELTTDDICHDALDAYHGCLQTSDCSAPSWACDPQRYDYMEVCDWVPPVDVDGICGAAMARGLKCGLFEPSQEPSEMAQCRSALEDNGRECLDAYIHYYKCRGDDWNDCPYSGCESELESAEETCARAG